MLADALTGNVDPLWSMRLTEWDDQNELDELLVRARHCEHALAMAEEHCQLWSDGHEERVFRIKVWRVIDGTGRLGFEQAGTFRVMTETLCRDCGHTENAHDQRPRPDGCCDTYFLGTEQRCSTTPDATAPDEG